MSSPALRSPPRLAEERNRESLKEFSPEGRRRRRVPVSVRPEEYGEFESILFNCLNGEARHEIENCICGLVVEPVHCHLEVYILRNEEQGQTHGERRAESGLTVLLAIPLVPRQRGTALHAQMNPWGALWLRGPSKYRKQLETRHEILAQGKRALKASTNNEN